MTVERWWRDDADDGTAFYDVISTDGRRISRYVSKRELDELVTRLERAGETFEVVPTGGRPGSPAP